MPDFRSLLTKRMRSQEDASKKMDKLALKSTSGELSGFSGVFKVAPLTSQEQSTIENILNEYKTESQNIEVDLKQLKAITSEVKAINNQAIILHGERIKQAQNLLKPYRDGAFTAWLIATYGNRQTPYNFLQYYEFYNNASSEIKEKIDLMPKQAIYTLASREGPIEKKESLIKEYKGEAKQLLLEKIRESFPLKEEDKRSANKAINIVKLLHKISSMINSSKFHPAIEERQTIKTLLNDLIKHV
ncbi:MAG: CT583 family protein [Chlamydiales bacterium]|nr:CT583 family protein [Chlamydiales bacterium]